MRSFAISYIAALKQSDQSAFRELCCIVDFKTFVIKHMQTVGRGGAAIKP